MASLLSTTAICLIACHGGPADHFATFAENLMKEGYKVEVYASGPALKKFQDRHIEVVMPFTADNLSLEEEIALADQIAKTCSKFSSVMTDVGHRFDIPLQKALALQAPHVVRLAYYDNPEPFVPGGYSQVAAQVMQIAQEVLFANANLSKDTIYQEPQKEISIENRIGLGYYPIAQVEKIVTLRERGQEKRKEFFAEHHLEDKGQKVLVYFGGNNEEYFTKAFPAFLNFLTEGSVKSDLSHIIIVMQQHPGAKSKNLDGQQIEKQSHSPQAPKIVISNWTSEQIQAIAEVALYYQTSMGPQFALAGIPTIQVGHQTYEDILVRGRLSPSATTASQLIGYITQLKAGGQSQEQRAVILKSLGIKDDWLQILQQAVKKS